MFTTESTISINCFKQTKLLSFEEINSIQNKKKKEIKLKNNKKQKHTEQFNVK